MMQLTKLAMVFILILLFSQTLRSPSAAATQPRNKVSVRSFQLMSQDKYDRLRRQLPRVEEDWMQEILDDPALMLYTEDEIPSAYQDWSSGLPGIHSPSYNVSANNSEPYGNANVEFPWGAPGGTHRTNNVTTFRFLLLPQDDDGQPRPIVWYRKFLKGSSSEGYAWTFPVGTVVGEVLQMRGPGNRLYTFELRVRTRETGQWTVDVFRPFPSSDKLATRIKELRPDWQDNVALNSLVNHLQQPHALPRRSLSDSNHSRQVFHQSMGIDKLPPVGDDELVAQLLTETVFSSALGSIWYTGANNEVTSAPTTDAAFHIVPAQYDAGFIEVDRFSCMRCHDTVNQHVNDFAFGRDWYGRVRGSDGIFSIHPFDPSCVSHSGSPRPVQMNYRLTSAGLLVPFDPSVHTTEHYNQLRNVDE